MVTPCMICLSPILEHRAVTDDLDAAVSRRRGASRASRGRRPRCRLENLASGNGPRIKPSRCRTPSARRSSSATVSARHSTTSARADLVLALRVCRVAQGEHAAIDEQSAVAVFGKAGESVDVGDLDACPLQRLDQRIGKACLFPDRAAASRRHRGYRHRRPHGTSRISQRRIVRRFRRARISSRGRCAARA